MSDKLKIMQERISENRSASEILNENRIFALDALLFAGLQERLERTFHRRVSCDVLVDEAPSFEMKDDRRLG
jgi:hypothetical protein